MKTYVALLSAISTAIACTLLVAKDSVKEQSNESKLLSNTRQLTFAGKRSGEGYYSSDGNQMIFQSERESI